MGNLWVGAWIASLTIGVLVWGLIIYAAVRYRRRRGNSVPKQTKYNLPMELMYTIIPLLIIAVLFFFTVKAQNEVLDKSEPVDHTINVVGQKWSWTFNYMEAENPEVGDVVHQVGTMSQIPDLYLPVNKPVRFNLASPDVIHSFWIPAFYFKLDVIPGHANSFDVTPTKLGTYDGKCAELCGTYHAHMIFKVHVVTEQEYYAKLKELAANGQTGEKKVQVSATSIATKPAEEQHK
ncbi:cytochrome c oxidase subunit II [Propionibacteriaceae bacterium G1746]